ncbi:ATP-binding cassette domain-containing protein [Brevibacillus laterosporus]|uniref:ATP-binding cassette domain-containing protein n=1 Tax=Brevibacillus laterosporus TaxID=1465 RepID=UPI0024062324|nr:ATP-binding cassette domain-containing protein [Brevibacillus laterosporus]
MKKRKEHKGNDKVKTYSLGMKQRLGIAQSLLNNPRIVILDEPANGLDPKESLGITSLFPAIYLMNFKKYATGM